MGESTSYSASYLRRQLQRGSLRRAVRSLYLRHQASLAVGAALDMGCGPGQLLSRLPTGSKGLEVNRAAVQHAREKGLDVDAYDPDTDRYQLRSVSAGRFGTLIMSHVLEHLAAPEEAIRGLAASALRLGMRRLVFIVPGLKGYRSDDTHLTFIDLAYLRERHLLELEGWVCSGWHYFPINVRWIGRYFTHHELTVIYDRA